MPQQPQVWTLRIEADVAGYRLWITSRGSERYQGPFPNLQDMLAYCNRYIAGSPGESHI